MKDLYNEVLLGHSIPLPEEEPDDNRGDVDFQYHIYTEGIEFQEDALREYRFITVLDNIKTPEFKQNYLSVINSIKSEYTLREQILFCERILEKIEEVYNFVFPQNVKLYDSEDVNNVYAFLEFLEFNCENFVVDVWQFLDTNLRDLNIERYCKDNIKGIIQEVERQVETHVLHEMTSQFLRTYNKEGMTEWFSEMTKRSRSLIILRVIEMKTEVRENEYSINQKRDDRNSL